MMFLTVGRTFNCSVPIVFFVVLLWVCNLGWLSFLGSLIYSDLISCIFDISYIDIGKQYAPFYYIYNK